MEQKEIVNPSQDLYIETVRIINVTREKMFEAWTNPEHLKNWWGPDGFTNTFHEFNPTAGGKWAFTMHGPDGKNYPNESVFIKLEKPELIILNHIVNPIFQLQARFTEVSGMTEVNWKMIFETAELRNSLKTFIEEKNEENLNRLEVELLNMR